MDNNKRTLDNVDAADLTASGEEKIADKQQPLKKIKKKETQESSDVNETDANKTAGVAVEPMDEDKIEAEKLTIVSKVGVRDIEQQKHPCGGGEGCPLAACNILSSSLNPSEALFRCWDCTNKDVGMNNTTGSTQWMRVVKKNCTKSNANAAEEVATTNVLLDPSNYSGGYSTLPGGGNALIVCADFAGQSLLGSYLRGVMVNVPSNTTKLEEATLVLNILRDIVHRYLKISVGQSRVSGEEYVGLNAVGAEEAIIDKFRSVMSRYELMHYTDENALRESALSILGIWRECSTQAEALESDYFVFGLDLDMKNALRKFWGHTVH